MRVAVLAYYGTFRSVLVNNAARQVTPITSRAFFICLSPLNQVHSKQKTDLAIFGRPIFLCGNKMAMTFGIQIVERNRLRKPLGTLTLF